MRRKITLTSIPMIHTPGLLRWGRNGYAHKRDQQAIRAVFVEGYGLPEDVAHDLLTGEIQADQIGENIEFVAEVPNDWKPS
jgi:hypothetical protein